MELKINYLNKLLNKLLLFSKHYSSVKINLSKTKFFIKVTWTQPKDWKWSEETIKFPADDLDKRIEHYRNKLKTEFINRKSKIK